jgi:hypothetical protein
MKATSWHVGSDRAWRVLTFGPDQIGRTTKARERDSTAERADEMANKVQYVLGWADQPRIADTDYYFCSSALQMPFSSYSYCRERM